MAKLYDEIKRLNQSKRVKIHLNKLNDGSSLYIEYNKDYRRERQFLNLKISGKNIVTKKDSEILYKAEIIRDLKELELFGNGNTFALKNRILEADFFKYFKTLGDKKKLPSYNGSLKQLITLTIATNI